MTIDGLQKISSDQVDGIAVLTLASDKVNALDVETLGELRSAMEQCDHDDSVRGVVLTGQGSIFSAGLNVAELLENDPSYVEVLLDALDAALLQVFGSSKPTIAAVNGPAIAGGCILACACDRRLIAESARIGVTELRVGVAFPTLAIELLRYACGGFTESLIMDADLLDAESARRVGLVHEVVADDELRDRSVAVALELAARDAAAYGLAKRSMRRSVLAAAGDTEARGLDDEVRSHWQRDSTRQSLERLRAPKR